MKNYILIFIALGIFAILNRSYAQNSLVISFDTITVKKYGLTFRNGAVFDFVYQFISPSDSAFPVKRIKEQLIQKFFQIDSIMSLEQAQKQYEDSMLANVEPEPISGVPYRFSEKVSAIKINHNKVLAFFSNENSFFGGAHGTPWISCSCYDLQSSNRIFFNDLFDNNAKIQILSLINEKLGANVLNKNCLGWIDNFVLLPKGIVFIFNQGAVDCNAAGTIKVLLPLSKIRHLLKPTALTYFEE